MKKLLFVLSFLLLILFAKAQEAFKISDYVVDIELNTNGSFDVFETIRLNFTEERRGIIRGIPVVYLDSTDATDEDRAIRYKYGEYQIHIDNVNVENVEFTTYYENGKLNIRIGSADKYLMGEQTYKIHYTVWGAINEFVHHAEFAWNVIGTEWDTEIDQVTFNLHFPKKIPITNKDVKVFSGAFGETKNGVSYTVSQTGISGKTTQKLTNFEGLTLLVKLPNNFFTQHYTPLKSETKVYISKQGYIELNENYSISFNGYQQYVLYNMTAQGIIQNNNKLTYSNFYAIPNTTKDIALNGTDYLMIAATDAENYFTGYSPIYVSYKVWNNIKVDANGELVRWRILGTKIGKSIDSTTFVIQLHDSIRPVSFVVTKNGKQLTTKLESRTYSIETGKMTTTDEIIFEAQFPKGTFTNITAPPFIETANAYIVTDFKSDIYIQPDGKVKVNRKYTYFFKNEFTNGAELFRTSLSSLYSYTYSDILHQPSELPKYGFLGDYYNMIIDDIQIFGKGEIFDDYFGKTIYSQYDANSKDSTFEYQYSVYNLLFDSGNDKKLTYRILDDCSEPYSQGKLVIHFPVKISEKDVKISFKEYDQPVNFPVLYGDSTITVLFPNTYKPYSSFLIFTVTFPESYAGSNLMGEIRLYVLHNTFLFIPIALFAILFVVWLFLGRDTKQTLVVQYFPPKGITPAEAGYLWDGKLHKRDLISLLYYWAGNGQMTIKTLENDNFELTKLKDLPSDAKSFEGILFNALFWKREVVKSDDLRNSFFSTIKAAESNFATYSNTQKLFVPGSKGFGKILSIVGYITAAIAMLMFTVAANSGDFKPLIVSTLCATILIIFGRIMPKFGHFGEKAYSELLGFREFVEKAEVDRLRVLLSENPDYFDKTMAYCIVLGLGAQWASKFEALITAPPAWFSTTGDAKDFKTSLFVRQVVRSMYKINDDFHYKAPATRSYSSYSSSSKSSSYKSSSSWSSSWSKSSYSSSGSGKSSFSSSKSSGYSGSGYGGGGGSSW